MSGNRRIDPTERAHLRDPHGYTPPIYRFAPRPELADVVRRYWLPVWSLPTGPPEMVSEQRVLQYPVCNIVVSGDYAILAGPHRGMSTQRLAGTGWGLGAMLQPAPGEPLLGSPVSVLTDRQMDLDAVPGLDGAGLAARVRAAIGDDPHDPARQQAAVSCVEDVLASLPPVDEEGLLVNAIAEYVEGDPDCRRVGQVCAKFGMSERSLQRLTARRLGLTPKWLISRRRLHEAAERLRDEPVDLARVATELGYADQAHLSRDFKTVTGLTPRQFATEPKRP